MKYFTKANSEEELKEQYRRLLIKYDYKSGKNDNIIKEIEQEYKAAIKQIPLEQRDVPAFVKAASRGLNAIEQKKQAEEDRKKALETRHYTKEDLAQLLNEKRSFIRQSLIEIMRIDTAYEPVRKVAMSKDKDFLVFEAYRHQVEYLLGRDLHRWNKDLHSIEEKIEYAVFSLSGQNEKNTEEVLQKIDMQMGTYIRKILPDLEEKYCDPVVIRKIIKSSNSTANKMANTGFKFVLISFIGALAVPALLIIGITFVFVKELVMEGEFLAALQSLGIGAVILLVYYVIIRLCMNNGWKAKTTARPRVRFEEQEKKKNQNRRILTNILRIIKNMI